MWNALCFFLFFQNLVRSSSSPKLQNTEMQFLYIFVKKQTQFCIQKVSEQPQKIPQNDPQKPTLLCKA